MNYILHNDGKEFFNENKDFIDLTTEAGALINEYINKVDGFLSNSFAITIIDENEKLIAIAYDTNLVVAGNEKLSYVLANIIFDYNLNVDYIYSNMEISIELGKRLKDITESGIVGYEHSKLMKFHLVENKIKNAYFAGGCFWCLANAFNDIPGILKITSGYMGDTIINPTYKNVKMGDTLFRETIKITYDSKVISYKELLDMFFSNIDPFDPTGQFIDKGTNYLSGIFTSNEEEIKLFKECVRYIEDNFNQKVCVDLLPDYVFYSAEEEHQDYSKKHPDLFKKEIEESGRNSYSFVDMKKK